MYAIVETGGKQVRVAPGDRVTVEKLPGEEGEALTLDRVLMVVDDEGNVKVGSPYVEGVVVSGTLVSHGKGPKILVFKYKPKVNYRRRMGHRQPLTVVEVTEIRVS